MGTFPVHHFYSTIIGNKSIEKLNRLSNTFDLTDDVQNNKAVVICVCIY